MASTVRHGRDDDGFTSVVFIAAAGLVLLTFVLFAQFVVWQYGRGAARAAIDRAARAGARPGGTVAECETTARAELAQLLGGQMGDGVTVTCQQEAGVVTAHAQVTFKAWLPPSPDWTFTIDASDLKERRP
jgi:hypothetical protein